MGCGLTFRSFVARGAPMGAAARPALSGFGDTLPCLHRVLATRRCATTNPSLAEEKDHA